MRLKSQAMEFMTGFLKSHNMATDEGAAAGGGHLPACCRARLLLAHAAPFNAPEQ